MKLGEVLDRTVRFFQEKRFLSARADAEILLSHALGTERIRLYLEFDRPLSDAELERSRELVRRRTAGEPVAYIVGQKGFFGLDFEVSPAVLIPRPETESLVELAIDHARLRTGEDSAPLRVADLGTGSGCVGLSVLKNLPAAVLTSVDLSSAALSVAARNAKNLGLADRVTFVEGDAADVRTAPGTYDVILANPPYIDPSDARVEPQVREFEPSMALFGGAGGMEVPIAWLRAWAPRLTESGLFAMEIGADQGSAMKGHFEETGLFSDVVLLKDLAGHDRVVKGVRRG